MTESTNPSFNEAFEGLTGDAEDAIQEHYGLDIYATIITLADDAILSALPIKPTRALILGHLVSSGTPKDAAVNTVRAMTMKQVMDYFTEDIAEADPDDPDTEAGKGDSPASTSKRSARSGA